MPAVSLSGLIPLIEPAGAAIAITTNADAGTLTIALQIGKRMTALKVDADGWRALSLAIGTPPAPEFVPGARQCIRCGRDSRTVKNWCAANLCAACINQPIPRRVGGGR